MQEYETYEPTTESDIWHITNNIAMNGETSVEVRPRAGKCRGFRFTRLSVYSWTHCPYDGYSETLMASLKRPEDVLEYIPAEIKQ